MPRGSSRWIALLFLVQTSEGKRCVCVFLILLPLLFPFLRVPVLNCTAQHMSSF
ncbi:hypothetical protein JOB18_033036 [Solea senegalensis]|uniref:Uncharacterized protein n=1 Tax=Solea senegalensis TaxID=28829 RepID=A0AAV6PRV7_SOLSE|nr:hypothetical protein JOB18_033036 [Solea senegalensis]